MHRDGIELNEEVVDFIAHNVRNSVRDLEGILASLLAHSTLVEREIDIQLAEQVISHIVAIQPKQTSIADVLGAVCEHYNLPEKAVVSQNRSKEIAHARHVVFYICKQMTNNSLVEIGLRVGKRTHATVLHSISYIKDQLEYDPVLRQHVNQIQATLEH
jgi:chromosomal replication initiator protein